MQIKTALMLSTLALSGAVLAQAKAPEPDYTLSFNAGVVSDYRYRGISQTRLKPAVQAGADFAHKSGFYLGAWGSSIKWIEDNSVVSTATPVKGSVELDLYGGYKGAMGAVGYDVGVLRYQYVGNTLEKTGGTVNGIYANANTTEVYLGLTYSVATFKYSRSTGNLFGYLNSKGSEYFDLSATFDLGNGFTLTPHVGHQYVAKTSIASYTDYSVTVAKDLGNGVSLSLAAVGTDSDKGNYANPVNGKFMGKSGVVLGAKYSF